MANAKPTTRPKTVAKSTNKPEAKPLANAKGPARVVAAPPPAKADGPAKAPKAVDAKQVDAGKAKKPKLVRDSFTMPKAEYDIIDALKRRSALAGYPAKKSEILRAGLKALADMTAPAFQEALDAVPRIKTGRRPKDQR
jgi:hypothetical protein